jgi:hypothetical protein
MTYKKMPMTELTISEVRKALLDLPEKLARGALVGVVALFAGAKAMVLGHGGGTE